MSNSTEIGNAGRFPGIIPARAPEKSSTFSQTCSLLSQYLKEKKTALGDLSLGMNTKSDSHGMTKMMMMMIPEKFRQATTTMDLFPQESGFAAEKATVSEPETAQMTIFYNGQVIVLNDFPAEKAKQVMMLATKESASTFSAAIQKPVEDCANRIVSDSSNSKIVQDCVVVPPRPKAVEAIPIARKASLTRFLEKRKDRITTRAPYPVRVSSGGVRASPQKPVESKSWLGLGAQYPLQFGHQL